MKCGKSRWGIASALMVVSAASQAQSLQIWNPAQMGQQGDYSANLSKVGTATVEGRPAVVLNLHGQWAQFGKNFSTPQDWSAYEGGMITLQNRNTFEIELGLQFGLGVGGTNPTGTSVKIPAGQTLQFFVDTSAWQSNFGVQRMPYAMTSTYYRHKFANREAVLNTVYQWQVFYKGTQPAQIAVGEVKLYDRGHDTAPRVDQFGQITDRTWSGKIANTTQLVDAITTEADDLQANPGGSQLYGSSALPSTTATGKWRVERTSTGKAYFVTPAGKRYWAFGITNVCAIMPTLVTGREASFQDLPAVGEPAAQFYQDQVVNGQNQRTYDFYKANQLAKHGSDWMVDFANLATRRLKSWNMNCVGSGSWNAELHASAPMPFVTTMSTNAFPTRLTTPLSWKSFPDPYASNFKSWLVTNLAFAQWHSRSETRNEFLGLYVDGEMPWGDRAGAPSKKYALPMAILARPGTQPAKARLAGLMRTRYGSDLAALNAAYGTNVPSWGAFSTSPFVVNPNTMNAQVQADMSFLLLNVASAYFSNVKAAMNQAGVTGLYLGSRDMAVWTPDEVWNAAKSSVDVISVNHYDEANLVPWSTFASLKKPVLLSEFSYVGRDLNSTSGTSMNEGVEARDQAHRAAKAEAMLTAAAKQKNVIGAFWFRYIDQPVSGVAFNGENYQVGAVNIVDRPYQPLVDVFRRFGQNVYSIRGGL